jgi:transposase InsO family protein
MIENVCVPISLKANTLELIAATFLGGIEHFIGGLTEVFHNRKRRHSTLGYLSPVAFEEKKKVA